MGSYVASLAMGTAGGAVMTDSLNAIPVNGTTADGTPVKPGQAPTAQAVTYLSSLIVLIALGVLVLGGRWLRNARIA